MTGHLQTLKVQLRFEDLVHHTVILARCCAVDQVVRAGSMYKFLLIRANHITYHMTAPVPARTASANEGRYSSFSVFSEIPSSVSSMAVEWIDDVTYRPPPLRLVGSRCVRLDVPCQEALYTLVPARRGCSAWRM